MGRESWVGTMVQKIIVVLAIATFTWCASAPAEELNDGAQYQEVLSTLAEIVGGSVEAKTEAGQRVVTVTVDREKVNGNFDKLQKLKLLNPDITQTFIALHENVAGMTIATQLAVMAVVAEYRTQKQTDKCRFATYFLVADDFGQKQKNTVVFFRLRPSALQQNQLGQLQRCEHFKGSARI